MKEYNGWAFASMKQVSSIDTRDEYEPVASLFGQQLIKEITYYERVK